MSRNPAKNKSSFSAIQCIKRQFACHPDHDCSAPFYSEMTSTHIVAESMISSTTKLNETMKEFVFL